MEIEIGGKQYFVAWQYKVEETRLGEREVTYCLFKKDGEVKYSAFTIKNPKDASVKNTARKISLSYVLDALDLTKQERKAVWEQYLNR